ncbi:hypothetical protein ACYULU_09915, partial [Breznakiellaceae bacterium SP9]
TKSRIGGAVAALAVRAAVAKKIVAGAGIAAVGASLVACPNPTDPAYDADAVRAEVEAWLNTTMLLEPPNPMNPSPTPFSIAFYISIGYSQTVVDIIDSGIAAQLSAKTIESQIITNLGIANLLVSKTIIKSDKLNPLNKKQYIAAANRNAKSVVALRYNDIARESGV